MRHIQNSNTRILNPEEGDAIIIGSDDIIKRSELAAKKSALFTKMNHEKHNERIAYIQHKLIHHSAAYSRDDLADIEITVLTERYLGRVGKLSQIWCAFH